MDYEGFTKRLCTKIDAVRSKDAEAIALQTNAIQMPQRAPTDHSVVDYIEQKMLNSVRDIYLHGNSFRFKVAKLGYSIELDMQYATPVTNHYLAEEDREKYPWLNAIWTDWNDKLTRILVDPHMAGPVKRAVIDKVNRMTRDDYIQCIINMWTEAHPDIPVELKETPSQLNLIFTIKSQ